MAQHAKMLKQLEVGVGRKANPPFQTKIYLVNVQTSFKIQTLAGNTAMLWNPFTFLKKLISSKEGYGNVVPFILTFLKSLSHFLKKVISTKGKVFLSLNNWGLNFLQNKCSQFSQIYLSQEKLREKIKIDQNINFAKFPSAK